MHKNALVRNVTKLLGRFDLKWLHLCQLNNKLNSNIRTILHIIIGSYVHSLLSDIELFGMNLCINNTYTHTKSIANTLHINPRTKIHIHT